MLQVYKVIKFIKYVKEELCRWMRVYPFMLRFSFERVSTS
jgi:hypothetical protein